MSTVGFWKRSSAPREASVVLLAKEWYDHISVEPHKIRCAAQFWTNWSQWIKYFGSPYNRELQLSNLHVTKVWTNILVFSADKNFLIREILRMWKRRIYKWQPLGVPCSNYCTGGPSSSCEIIVLRNNSHWGIIRVCTGILTTALRNKKIRQILKKKNLALLPQRTACYLTASFEERKKLLS